MNSHGDGFLNDDGDAVFQVSFSAITYKPVVGEIIDAIVTKIEEVSVARNRAR